MSTISLPACTRVGKLVICYNTDVRRKKKGKGAERPVFDSIRKPTAPPTRKFGGETADEKRLPSLRKVKHKKSPEPDRE